jgi:hypothetical protein
MTVHIPKYTATAITKDVPIAPALLSNTIRLEYKANTTAIITLANMGLRIERKNRPSVIGVPRKAIHKEGTNTMHTAAA